MIINLEDKLSKLKDYTLNETLKESKVRKASVKIESLFGVKGRWAMQEILYAIVFIQEKSFGYVAVVYTLINV